MSGRGWVGTARRLAILVVVGALAVSVGTLAMGSATAAEEITGCMDEDETASINESGHYVLANDLQGSGETCIEITADDVVLDGQGHAVDGDGTRSAFGIEATSQSFGDDLTNVTVTDIEVRGWNGSFSYGLIFTGASHGEISNVTAVENGGAGIALDDFNDNITVTDSTANGNDRDGIFMRDSTDNRLRNNTVSMNGDDGIQSNAGVNNTFRNNTANDNGDDGIRLNDNFGNEDSLVVNNTANGNDGAGFFTGDGDNNTLRDNGAYGNGDAIVLGENAATSEVERLDIGDSTAANTTLSMQGENVSVDAATAPPDNPNAAGIGRYFEATNTTADASLNVSVHYDEGDVADVNESSLSLWRYDGGSWGEVGGATVDTGERTVDAEITDFSTFGAFAGSNPVAEYANSEGVVDTEGLREGIDDWRGGDTGTDLLREVIDYWRSGEPVE